MIERLRGAVVETSEGSVLLEVGGVGFRLQTSAGAEARLPGPGAEATLVARTLVHRDDGFVLYGFGSSEEADLFDRLRSISGVGPAVALNLLALTPGRLREAIRAKDVKRLQGAPGVGLRIARRVITELAESLPDDLATDAPGGPEPEASAADLRRQDLVSALMNLQFADRRRIEEVVASVLSESPDETLEAQFRQAIGRVAARRSQ